MFPTRSHDQVNTMNTRPKVEQMSARGERFRGFRVDFFGSNSLDLRVAFKDELRSENFLRKCLFIGTAHSAKRMNMGKVLSAKEN